jgi:hypothetical protein
MNELERLESLLRVEPPADLDAIVTQRLGSALATLRAEVQAERQQKRIEPAQKHGLRGALDGPQRAVPAVALPLAERCVYAVGLLTIGTQAVTVLARFVWRALTG